MEESGECLYIRPGFGRLLPNLVKIASKYNLNLQTDKIQFARNKGSFPLLAARTRFYTTTLWQEYRGGEIEEKMYFFILAVARLIPGVCQGAKTKHATDK